jgi:hypothetical protein
LLPSKRQYRALETLLESQRQLYNAALEERIGAFRNAGITRTYIDQCKALTEWRQSDREAAAVPLCLQRWTIKQLDEAYRGFFRRVRAPSRDSRAFAERGVSIASAFASFAVSVSRTADCVSMACRARFACIFTAACPRVCRSAHASFAATRRGGR